MSLEEKVLAVKPTYEGSDIEVCCKVIVGLPANSWYSGALTEAARQSIEIDVDDLFVSAERLSSPCIAHRVDIIKVDSSTALLVLVGTSAQSTLDAIKNSRDAPQQSVLESALAIAWDLVKTEIERSVNTDRRVYISEEFLQSGLSPEVATQVLPQLFRRLKNAGFQLNWISRTIFTVETI